MNEPAVTLKDIEAAAAAISGSVANTPCLHSRTLSAITGAQIYLKFENHQFTASFKERGALNKLLSLTSAERNAGVIAASAGNHAQGVAHNAKWLGIPTVIVMPRFTPVVKVQQTRDHGAEVILHGENFDEAKAHAYAIAAQRKLIFVHPYDDEKVIAGQGTLAPEMLAQHPQLECLVVPIGGGGIISGMAVAAKSLKPAMRVIGVQTERYPSMFIDPDLTHLSKALLGAGGPHVMVIDTPQAMRVDLQEGSSAINGHHLGERKGKGFEEQREVTARPCPGHR